MVEQAGLGVQVGLLAELADQDGPVQGEDRRHREQGDQGARGGQSACGERAEAQRRELEGELVAAEEDL
ncbi:hypothetical protein FRP1_15090 [Pseudonocardia sp. EC080625-04]|uniref:hypothetical protein n=1 Tax=Pseudonocardia sp. EC080625-04 TaxID=1096868 RepID=UPI0006CB3929|nr:hypothetical protein [Pseudonocardia sp. EC080625-04]ALE74014.1 hypothetical protein FRP1_15090 [Pseudonocardia sp. EC080625-04]